MSYDRLAPTVSSKAKKLFGSGNMGQNNWGAGARPPVPLSDGLDTRPCKILDPPLCNLKTKVLAGITCTRDHFEGTVLSLGLDNDNDNVFISDLWPIRRNRQLGLYVDIHVSKFRKTKQKYTI